jgi:protein SCO1/2
MRAAFILALAFLASATVSAPAHDAPHPQAKQQRLRTIGAAPAFALTSQDGVPVALADLRGKVVAVTFIYTSCADTCPMLTALMVHVQDKLGRDFGERIAFVSITVDPERDTPDVLRQYADTFGADRKGWAFLTGDSQVIREVTRRYGVFAANTSKGEVDHTFLTSIVDRKGMLRVQYLGVRFDPDEFHRDLLSLLKER